MISSPCASPTAHSFKRSPAAAYHRPLQLLSRSLLAASALLLTACATSIISPELEQEMGSQMSVQVAEQVGLYQDEELSAYLQSVGARVVSAVPSSPYTFKFHIVDQGEPNAFASPGGYIYVSRGLLAQVNSEAELAGVLAHEISHVTQRHHAKQVGRSVRAGLMTLPGKAVAVVNESWGKSIADAGKIYLASYSRDQETEADITGMRLAATAGYDPLQLAVALRGIEQSEQLITGEKHEATFFDSHPTTPTRVAEVNRQAQDISWRARAPIADRSGLYRLQDGLWWGEQNPQQGVFQGQTFLSSDLDITITFPRGWGTINTPVFIGAHEPEGGAYIAVGAGERVPDPGVLTAALAQKMQQQAGLSPAEQRSFTIDGWPASLVRYDDRHGEQTVSLYYLFVSSPRETFTMMAMGLEQFREDLRDTALSLRPLGAEGAKSITGMRVRTATLRGGETFAQFSARTGNEWPLPLTRVINDLDQDSPPPAGELYKIMRTETYTKTPAQ